MLQGLWYRILFICSWYIVIVPKWLIIRLSFVSYLITVLTLSPTWWMHQKWLFFALDIFATVTQWLLTRACFVNMVSYLINMYDLPSIRRMVQTWLFLKFLNFRAWKELVATFWSTQNMGRKHTCTKINYEKKLSLINSIEPNENWSTIFPST